MKMIVLSGVATALLLLSGCASKDSAAGDSDKKPQVVKKVDPIDTEVVPDEVL